MKRFKCTVTRTDEYIIELDENVINKEFMSEFRQVFYNFTSLENHAEHLAQFQARIGNSFIEGYGHVNRDGKLIFSLEDYNKDGSKKPENERRKSAAGINIISVDEDNDCEIDIEDI